MNTWEDDEKLYRSAFDPNVQAAKEIESLRGQVDKLTREITALQRDLAAARQEREAWDKEFGKYLTKRYDFQQRALEEDSAAFVKGFKRQKKSVNRKSTRNTLISLGWWLMLGMIQKALLLTSLVFTLPYIIITRKATNFLASCLMSCSNTKTHSCGNPYGMDNIHMKLLNNAKKRCEVFLLGAHRKCCLAAGCVLQSFFQMPTWGKFTITPTSLQKMATVKLSGKMLMLIEHCLEQACASFLKKRQ